VDREPAHCVLRAARLRAAARASLARGLPAAAGGGLAALVAAEALALPAAPLAAAAGTLAGLAAMRRHVLRQLRSDPAMRAVPTRHPAACAGLADSWRGYGEGARVLAAQLEAAAVQVREAAGGIEAALDVVDVAIRGMEAAVREGGERLAGIGRETAHRLAESRETLERLRALRERMAGRAGRERERVQQVLEQCRGLTELARMVRAVADETNLLALNAAIKAARAGEHGRGFAVVADEVRGLSLRANEAARRIEESIAHVVSTAEAHVDAALAEQADAAECDVLEAVARQFAEIEAGYAEVAGELERLVGRLREAAGGVAARAADARGALAALPERLAPAMDGSAVQLARLAEEMAACRAGYISDRA